jgi:uncharacterized caspase-like protein
VGHFAEDAFAELEFAARDARRVAAYLADPAGGGFPPERVTLLTDREATRRRVLEAAQGLAAEAAPGEKVVVYFSTHGYYTPRGEVGIVCHDSAAAGRGPDGPLVDGATAITRQDLRRFLRGLRARRRALVADLCHSAAAACGLAEAAAPAGAGERPEAVTLVMASCRGRERAWESRRLGGSIFTHYLLEGLRQWKGDLVRAFEHARVRTGRRARTEKGWNQTPCLELRPAGGGLRLGREAAPAGASAGDPP